MARSTFKPELPNEQSDLQGSARVWPLAQGNPFLSLGDPEYNGRILKDRANSLKGLASPRAHTAAVPLDLLDADT